MKSRLIKMIKENATLVIALVALAIFTGHTEPGKNSPAANCCTGYSMTTDKLKKFMLDSLHNNQFEGGVFSKADLLSAINKIPGDSIYLLNVNKGCNFGKPNDLAFTSPTASGVAFVKQPNCYPCPGKSCCPPKVCVARINRACINYTSFMGLTQNEPGNILSAEQ